MPALIILYFSIESHSQNIISTSTLLDKIKGGWAGQTIGVTFGGPVEFRYNGTMIQTYHPIPWYKGYVAEMMTHNDGLYDDLYMDLTWALACQPGSQVQYIEWDQPSDVRSLDQ